MRWWKKLKPSRGRLKEKEHLTPVLKSNQEKLLGERKDSKFSSSMEEPEPSSNSHPSSVVQQQKKEVPEPYTPIHLQRRRKHTDVPTLGWGCRWCQEWIEEVLVFQRIPRNQASFLATQFRGLGTTMYMMYEAQWISLVGDPGMGIFGLLAVHGTNAKVRDELEILMKRRGAREIEWDFFAGKGKRNGKVDDFPYGRWIED